MCLVALAGLKILGAFAWLAIANVPIDSRSGVPSGFITLQLVAFGGSGAVLVLAHARDRRTAHLGVVFILVASAFATSYFAALAELTPGAPILAQLYPDAFLAFFVGRFIQEFPRRPTGWATRLLAALTSVAGIVGVVLVTANAILGWSGTQTAFEWLSPLQRRSAGGTAYWTSLFGLLMLMLPLAFTGMRALERNERRRIRLFWSAFLVGLGPAVLIVVLSSLPRFGSQLTRWVMTGWMLSVAELLLASVPVSTAYAVLVHRLLPLRLVIRRAVRYLLARWTVTTGLVLPTALLIAQAYSHRHETIAEFFDARGLALLTVAGMSGVALFARDTILRTIDRWFFREAFDAQTVWLELSEESRRVHRVEELVALLTAGTDRAFQPESVTVLVRDAAGRDFVSVFGSVEPLATSSVLIEVMSRAGQPLDVSLEDSRSPLRSLPRAERQWLVDSRSRLLVPLRASDCHLVGLITVGDRKSELPYTREDRRLLLAMADAGALTIENHVMRSASFSAEPHGLWWHTDLAPRQSHAAECTRCGLVQASEITTCHRCRGEMATAEVPHVLFGKFRFEERVGRGGMGVVYRATDLALDRVVAIKTLPGTSPEHAQRMRLEARAMAAVTHRNLAIIHGTESWRGRPMLVCEFMTQGTLAGKLARGPLSLASAIDLGIALAEALDVIHAAGLLHRDIKPSNIGYSQESVPKLLDFGLVHIWTQSTTPSDGPATPTTLPTDEIALSTLSLTQPLVGTPLYLSPEAILGQAPNPAFDLWSLNVLLLEAITGQHPYRSRTVEETLDRIRTTDLTGSQLGRGQIPAAAAAYFERALARDQRTRPASAREVSESLRALTRQP